MANLSVRKLDKNTYDQLRLRAARHGVSMEEEARQILSAAITGSQNITAVFKKNFGAKRGVDLDKKLSPRKPHPPLDFDE